MNSFILTLIGLLAITFVTGFVAQNYRDKCLRHIHQYPVVLERISGKLVKGILHVHASGLEFIFHRELNTINKLKPRSEGGKFIPDKKEKVVVHDAEHLQEASYLFYKYEYEKIQALIRYYSDLSDDEKRRRNRILERIYHPGFWLQLSRKSNNVIKKFKKSFSEIVDLSVATFQARSAAGRKMKLRKSSFQQLQKELTDSVGVAYDPLLEKYVGYRVVFELMKGEQKFKYVGILKDYSSQYLEFMDVKYSPRANQKEELADVVLPQRFAIVRSYAERSPDTIQWLQHLGFWINKPD